MNILKRMEAVTGTVEASEVPVPDGMAGTQGGDRRDREVRRRASNAALTGLAAAGAIHALWATGSSWPAASRNELADLVVGVRPFPSAPMTLGVVGLIAVGAGLVGLEARRLDHEHTAPSTPLGRLRRIAAIGVPAVLALRGVGGLVVSSFGLGEATEEFRHWDLRLYSPLCVVLAGLAWLAVRPATADNSAVGAIDRQ
ncbi:MAG: DUF3995 domain-containing protein [Acidimicrobiales bacterium]